MKIAIMQPYLFPYIGYYQLIDAVDIFVLYDDVNYIQRGWINRNRILLNGNEFKFTLPLQKASQNKLISSIKIAGDEIVRKKLLNTLHHAYRKAPYYKEVIPQLRRILLYDSNELVKYIENSLVSMCEFLGVKTVFLLSSSIEKNAELKGANKIIEICKKLNADHYINPVGGFGLYDKKHFKDENIRLSFLKSMDIRYQQFKNHKFIRNLSIVDFIMFNSVDQTRRFLEAFILV